MKTPQRCLSLGGPPITSSFTWSDLVYSGGHQKRWPRSRDGTIGSSEKRLTSSSPGMMVVENCERLARPLAWCPPPACRDKSEPHALLQTFRPRALGLRLLLGRAELAALPRRSGDGGT